MDLFELLGTISIKNEEANKALDETSTKGEKTQSKLSSAFSKIGSAAVKVGAVAATGLATAATAMGALTIKALNASGELEQNMGGSEAVFKEHAAKMQETAKTAFANMGLSTSDFLGTANKMGALFQGAGFSIEESSTLAADSMQRAADVASIMGIDTSAAMEAIAGAAKGNFTMMDNLGVAMNDTTIQAYALEHGIKKSTSEMTNQEKIGLAMEMFMEKTAYAAGNYAKENETLAGSLGTAKAALTNFLDGSGDVSSLIDAFSNTANVIVDNVKTIAPRLISGITDIANQVIPMIPPLLSEVLPVIVQGAESLITGLISVLPGLINLITQDVLPAAISAIEGIFNALVTALPQLISALVTALPTLVPMLLDSVVRMIVVLCENTSAILEPIIAILPDLILAIVDALMVNLPILFQGLVTLFVALHEMLPDLVVMIVELMPELFRTIVFGLIDALPTLLAGVWDILVALWNFTIETLIGWPLKILESLVGFFDVFADLWKMIEPYVLPIWEGILSGLQAAWDWIVELCSGIGTWLYDNVIAPVAQFFSDLWNGIVDTFHMVIDPWIEIVKRASEIIYNSVIKPIADYFSGLWTDIKNVFSTASSWFNSTVVQPVVNFFKGMWDGLKTGASNAWEGIKSVFSKVTSWFGDTFRKAWQKVKDVFSTGGKIFDGIKEGIVNSFKTVVNAIIRGINKVIKVPFEGLNKTIAKISKIEILGVKPFSWLTWRASIPEIPQLAKGGILEKGQVGLLEGQGAEAVVPLEKNREWISKVATEMTVATSNNGNVEVINMLAEIKELLIRFFPEALDTMLMPQAIDVNGLAVALTPVQAPLMNTELGKISIKKGRGR